MKEDEKTLSECNHDKAYFFHDNAPMYCPDCGNYIDGGNVISKIVKK